MNNYLTRPHYEHDDFGFCHTGQSFLEAANILENSKSWPPTSPICNPYPLHYLHRHAIELFLKSILLMAHKVNNNDRPEDLSSFQLNNGKGARPRPLVKCHRIDFLYECFLHVVSEKRRILVEEKNLWDWSDSSKRIEGLDDAIALIANADKEGALFRYPVDQKETSPKDIEKSTLQEANLDNSAEPAIYIAHPDKLYKVNTDLEDDLLTALRKSSDALSAAAHMYIMSL